LLLRTINPIITAVSIGLRPFFGHFVAFLPFCSRQ